MHPIYGTATKKTDEGVEVVESLNGHGERQLVVHLQPGANSQHIKDLGTLNLEGSTFYFSHEPDYIIGGPHRLVYLRGIHVGDTIASHTVFKPFVVQGIQVHADGRVVLQGAREGASAYYTEDPRLVSEREDSSASVPSCKLDPNNFNSHT